DRDMKEVYSNAIVLYGEDFEAVKGYVVVKDGVISEVGSGGYAGGAVDVKGGIIAPAFTNSHVHLGDSAGMDLGAYLPLEERVGKKGLKWQIHQRPDAKSAIMHVLDAMKKSGTTAFCDFREGGIRGVGLLKPLLNMQARILGRPDGHGDIMERCDGLGISSIKDYSSEELEGLLAKRSGRLIGIHAGEARDDVLEALAINPDFVVHLTNAGEESLREVFRRKIPIVLCPRANASFGVGIPDLKAVFESGCTVALGTDNVMANPPDMLREMEFSWKLYRGLYKDPEFDARTILKAATVNGRRILRLPDNTIEEGNRADFIVTRRFEHIRDPVLALVHRTSPSDIKKVLYPQASAIS
ncbi:MAG: amidohydrolase, partial [Methanobacteriota archaeon]